MEDIAAFLAKTVLFSVLPPAVLPAIARAATRVDAREGRDALRRPGRRATRSSSCARV